MIKGQYEGYRLNEMGYDFFDPWRSYKISPIGEDGIVEVFSWCSYSMPDEVPMDYREYFDQWYLDENLQPIPGIKGLHDYNTYADSKEAAEVQRQAREVFKKSREKAAQIVRDRG